MASTLKNSHASPCGHTRFTLYWQGNAVKQIKVTCRWAAHSCLITKLKDIFMHRTSHPLTNPSMAQGKERVAALGEAVEELGHLEEYTRTIQPSKQDASGLAVSPLQTQILRLEGIHDVLVIGSSSHGLSHADYICIYIPGLQVQFVCVHTIHACSVPGQWFKDASRIKQARGSGSISKDLNKEAFLRTWSKKTSKPSGPCNCMQYRS